MPVRQVSRGCKLKLINGVTKSQIANCISSRQLELTILPTEKCNFRCTYCYEDFELGRMKPHVIEGINRLISVRAPGLENLGLSWFGGEPLLAMPVVEKISRHAKELSQAYGFTLQGGLTTNGYLLNRENLSLLVSLNQDFYQISLDGWRETHDTTRLRADGKGTFDQIWSNLIGARDTSLEFQVMLRIHVTNDNHESLRTLCEEIYREFGGDSRFRLSFQDVRDLGGENGSKVKGVAAETFQKLTRELTALAERGPGAYVESPAQQSEGATKFAEFAGESASGRRAYMIAQDEPYICYASKPNHLLIRSNGRIGKCTVALNDDRNDIGWINPDGTVEVDQGKTRMWYRGLESLDLTDLGCPLAKMPKQHAKPSESPIPVAVLS